MSNWLDNFAAEMDKPNRTDLRKITAEPEKIWVKCDATGEVIEGPYNSVVNWTLNMMEELNTNGLFLRTNTNPEEWTKIKSITGDSFNLDVVEDYDKGNFKLSDGKEYTVDGDLLLGDIILFIIETVYNDDEDAYSEVKSFKVADYSKWKMELDTEITS